MKYKSYYNYRVGNGYLSLLRDMINVSRNLLLLFFYGKRSKKILFYPQFPDWSADIYQALFWSKYRLTSNPKEKFDYLVNWEDTTFRKADTTLISLARKHHALNMNCVDISKRKVEETFQKIFKYSTFVDPLQYEGKIIEKSDYNSKHSVAKILLAPIREKKPGFVYQKFLDNQENGRMVEYRTPFINNQIPLVFIRYKSQMDIFSNVLAYKTVKPMTVFDKHEMQLILKFCAEMQLEYGELDIIRNHKDKKIYIIDVNTTAHKPQSTCSLRERALKNKIIRQMFTEHVSSLNGEKPKPQKDRKKLALQ